MSVSIVIKLGELIRRTIATSTVINLVTRLGLFTNTIGTYNCEQMSNLIGS